jgi:hypothetical protein
VAQTLVDFTEKCTRGAWDRMIAQMMLATLWLFNIAMENFPFIVGLPIKNGDFPWLC